MVKLNTIIPQTIPLYHNGEYVRDINEYEFNDLRIQLQKEFEHGWYLIFNDNRIPIYENGRISIWYKGFFDLSEEQLKKLIGF